MARRGGAGVIGVRALQERCTGLVSSVLNRGLASEREVNEFRPGGEKNPDTTVWGWNFFQVKLHRWLEREQIAAGRSVRPDQVKTPEKSAADVLASDDQDMLNAMAGVGRNVALVRPIDLPDGTVLREITVYPKGRLALQEIHLLDEDVQWVHRKLQHLWHANDEGFATAEMLAAIAPGQRRILELQRRIVWILSTPGAWCPYEPDAIENPEVPGWTGALDEFDFTRILLAHRYVNELQIAHIAAHIPKGGDAKPARFSTFVAATAQETGHDPEELQKRWSLAKVYATAALAAKAKREALDAAKKAAA